MQLKEPIVEQTLSCENVRLNLLQGFGGPLEAAMNKSGLGSYSEYVTIVEDVQVSCVL